MHMVYGEPVNVQARDDGRPVRFVWRGRLYTVRVILEHWIINREWWQDPAPLPPEPGQPELEFWRVQASPGPGMTVGVYELRHEPAASTWTLRPAEIKPTDVTEP
jgi:hypothetical protein